MSRRLWLAFLIILVATVSCKPNSQTGIEDPENILFIGNSYTFINDLPEIFSGLAELGGHEVSVTTLAKAGYSLMEHTEDPQTREVIQSNNFRPGQTDTPFKKLNSKIVIGILIMLFIYV